MMRISVLCRGLCLHRRDRAWDRGLQVWDRGRRVSGREQQVWEREPDVLQRDGEVQERDARERVWVRDGEEWVQAFWRVWAQILCRNASGDERS